MADMAYDMEVHMVADMELYMVADMEVDKVWPTWRPTLYRPIFFYFYHRLLLATLSTSMSAPMFFNCV